MVLNNVKVYRECIGGINLRMAIQKTKVLVLSNKENKFMALRNQ